MATLLRNDGNDPAGALVVLWVGVSRVYSGVHYPADVVGGYLVGAVALLLVGMHLYPEHRWHSLRSALVTLAFRSREPGPASHQPVANVDDA